ncbi:proline reductase cluster protein PrdD [Caminicella sporogenes]|uniref:proline reductase cluster protein PrdD n=1 Tax=Caminicella sporogenes TaxID=166485 RepID=UPI00253F7E59|nr:proline reductase cluster protein PrdD [Caminicella sporogenes]WIF94014.1 proline reductase cluster protein PrdD [Caminicella sporogenes]
MKKEKIMRRLVIKSFHIDKVEYGEKSSIKNGVLKIDKKLDDYFTSSEDIFEKIKINIIEPGNYDVEINNIMDIIPISTKVLGRLGEGITHTLTGVYVLLTGADSEGIQLSNFGSSNGILREKLIFNRAGTPSRDDYIIHFDVILKSGLHIDRRITTAIHKTCDEFIQIYRNILKQLDGRTATESHEFFDKIRPGKKKIVIVKQVGGQGAMHDNQLFPDEPSGIKGGWSNIDLGNVPIILSPNEYRDGALKAMT